MSSPITRYAQEALVLLFSHQVNGFNAQFAQVAPDYGVPPIVIDWAPNSVQFFQFALGPDDVEESTPAKYPMVFMYGTRSANTHESMSRRFSGPVEIALNFWLSNETESAITAGSILEKQCNAIEETLNNMLTDGNWPQLYGAGNAVCLPPMCQRGRIDMAGQHWRQGLAFNLRFTLDTN